jgi:cell division cycle protein 20 (cofactor of APC complex)
VSWLDAADSYRADGSAAQTPITSVSWSTDGCYLAVGLDTGHVEIWDVEEGKKMRTMTGHSARVPSMSWFGHTLSSGCKDGSIWHHDVRVARHKVMELSGHTGEVSSWMVTRTGLWADDRFAV